MNDPTKTALRESADHYRILFESSRDAMMVLAAPESEMGTYFWDHATGMADYSPEFLALYDLPPDGTLTLGPDLVPLAVLDEDRPVFLAAMGGANDPQGDGLLKADYRIRRPDGSIRWLMARGRTEFEGLPGKRRPFMAAGVVMDITERKSADALAAIRQRLQQFAADHTLEELLRTTVDEAEMLSGSLAGFYHFVEADERTLSLQAWSTRTMAQFCGAEGQGRQYDIDHAGVWVDCIRERRPIFHNDCASLPDKKGLPEGHAQVLRELVVPILRNNKIVAILGVGNKATDYTETDISAITRLADVAWEIAHRLRAELALRDSEERLERIFNSSSNGMAFTEPSSGKILDVNDKWVRESGFSRTDAIGKTAEELGMWASKEEREAAVAILKRDGHLQELEATLVSRGTKRQFELNAEFMELRRGRFLLWELRDITERKQAETALRESEERYRAGFMTGLDAIFWATLHDGKILEVNPVFETVFGYPREEVIGRTSLELGLYCEPSDRARMVAELQDNSFVRDLELKARKKDGHIIIISLSVSKVLKSDQQFIYGVIRDITDRTLAEEETAKLTSQLQQAQKMESVGRLAGGVAHDFNNMLGVILGYSEMALEKVDPTDSLHGDLVNIRTSAQRSADLTRQLLAFARKQTVAPKVLNLNDTVVGMLKMVRRLIGEDVKLEWRPGENLWPVKIDPTQIDQILANLCVNARDAIANVGSITIETGTKVVSVDGTAKPMGTVRGDYVWLAVGDDGCGMDSATLSRLFEPFFTTKEVGKGTGLGLATVYGIVKQNNGFIDLHSELGQGTVLTIYLPRHVDKNVHERTGPTSVTTEPGLETILLVEDEAPLLEVTQRIQEKRGYKVAAASTPGQALQLAREHAGTIDLLITDVVMPEMNGLDLAKNFLSLYPLARCLFMSGYTADVIAHQGVLDESVSFIQKPFSAKDLAEVVRNVLDAEQTAKG